MSHSQPPNRRENQLRGQTSPYLLQHVYNPVDWYPWGEEALDRARREDLPIFLSIGYAACHWCHVMERESFENPEIAAFLNRHFVAIKVDREERPDLDEIYMNAIHLMSVQGGWPMSVFLTPDLRPFFGGTYFPPENRHGRIGFLELLARIEQAWRTKRDEIERSAGGMLEQLQRLAGELPESGDADSPGPDLAPQAAAELARRFDSRRGGFGGAPKFPPDGALELLLRQHARDDEAIPLQMAEKTLDSMALGGLYDQVGGGFSRYSVDEHWLVPHFEKMLYNQALLVPLYVDGWLLTGKPLYRRVVEQTLDFVRREMTGAGGGFYASLDADSEGEEGRYYVWSLAEIKQLLGDERAALFCDVYGVTQEGNFEGRNILNLLGGSLEQWAAGMGLDEPALEARLAPPRTELLRARAERIRPATDDKVLTAWNGLMISAFSRAYQTFGRPEDLASAAAASSFVQDQLARGDRLLVSWRDGHAHLNAYLDDYAFFTRGLIDLYECVFDRQILDRARAFADSMIAHFEDPEFGGFFFTSDDHERILTRQRSLHDGATPSGAGVAAEVLLRLASHLDDEGLRAPALRMLEAYHPAVSRQPSSYGAVLRAADLARGPIVQLVIAGDTSDPATIALLETVHRHYLPRRVLAVDAGDGRTTGAPLLAGKSPVGGRPTAYVCFDNSCREPTSDPVELARQLASVAPSRRV